MENIKTVDFKGKEYTIKYIHQRRVDEDKNILVKGGTTYAYIAEKDNVMIKSGMAVCSLKDNYSKSFGRKIARGRLLKYIKNGEKDESNS